MAKMREEARERRVLELKQNRDTVVELFPQRGEQGKTRDKLAALFGTVKAAVSADNVKLSVP